MNQYWKANNQISKGVPLDRINTYNKNVANYKPLTWKRKVMPIFVILLVFTFAIGAITKEEEDVIENLQENTIGLEEAQKTQENVIESNETSNSQDDAIDLEETVETDNNALVNGITEDGLYEYTKSNDTITLTRYLGDEKDVMIPSQIDGVDVTVIGNGLFYSNKSVVSVVIPDTVVEIQAGNMGGSAFGYMDNLQKVTIPGSVKVIGSCSFSGCSILSDVDMEEGIEEIGSSAFEGCYGLEEIIIPESVIKLDSGCFFKTGVTSITVNPECEVAEDIFFFGTDSEINYYE